MNWRRQVRSEPSSVPEELSWWRRPLCRRRVVQGLSTLADGCDAGPRRIYPELLHTTHSRRQSINLHSSSISNEPIPIKHVITTLSWDNISFKHIWIRFKIARIIHCVQKKNTHSHFLSYLHEWCVDLNKNCSEYTQGTADSENVEIRYSLRPIT